MKLTAAKAVIYTTIYFALAYGALVIFAYADEQSSPVWFASGWALFILHRHGIKWAGTITLGSALANYAISGDPLTSVAIAIGNTIEALIVYRFFAGFHKRWHLARFAGAVAAGCAVAAINGGLWIGGDPWAILSWFLGDVAGLLVFFPLLYFYARGPWGKLKEPAYYAFITALVSIPVFLFKDVSLAYIAIAPLLYSIWRLGIAGGMASIFAIMLVACIGFLLGTGPFANEGILLSQSYIIFLALIAGYLHLEFRNAGLTSTANNR